MARKKVERNISYDSERKRYYVTLQFGSDENNKPVKKTETFKTITEARKALRAHEAKRERGETKKPSPTTLEQWLSYWMTNIIIPQRAATTAYGYQNMIDNHIVPQLGSTPLQKLTPQKIQEYYTHLHTTIGLSNNTVRKHHDLLRTALSLAVRQDIIFSNPCERVEAPKVKPPKRSFYSPADLSRLLQCAEGHRLEPLICLAAYLGLRREEACGLRWSDLDFEEHTIRIEAARTVAGGKVIEKETKTVSSTRYLYMPPELEDVLLTEHARQLDDRAFLGDEYTYTNHVLVWNDGRPYRPNYLSELFTNFINANNLPPLTLHGLRHTFASLANRSGATMYDISKALGHSREGTTSMIYTHVFDDTHQDTITRVASSISKRKHPIQ